MLNTRIKELRTARNLSQVQMAKLLGCHKAKCFKLGK